MAASKTASGERLGVPMSTFSYDEETQIINMLNLKVGQEGKLACYDMLDGLPSDTKNWLKYMKIGEMDHRFSDDLLIVLMIWKDGEFPPAYWH